MIGVCQVWQQTQSYKGHDSVLTGSSKHDDTKVMEPPVAQMLHAVTLLCHVSCVRVIKQELDTQERTIADLPV